MSMSKLYSSPFDNTTRIGNDNCGLDQRNIMNLNAGNYMLTNYRSTESTMKKPLELATSQPNVFIGGGYHVAPGGSNIDANSEILFGEFPPRPKCKISLLQRPFATVPYLGRGESNPLLESYLLQGETANNKKSYNTLMEQSYMPYKNYPLIPELNASVNNPANLVEEVADDGWIRGGMPSREYARDKDYSFKHQ